MPLACEFSDEISGQHLVAVHWCVQNDVPLDYNHQCITVVDNTGASPVFAPGLQSDACPDEDVSGHCLGKDGAGKVSVYGEGFSPGELEQICQAGSFVSLPGRPEPTPTGCKVTISAPVDRTIECRGLVRADDDVPPALDLSSPDNQFRFRMAGWSGRLAGNYAASTVVQDVNAVGKVSYMAASWQLNVNLLPIDKGDFKLHVEVPVDSTTTADLTFHGTLDATFAAPEGYVDPITVHVEAD